MSPGSERGRPGGATSGISTAIKTDLSLQRTADALEQRRRARLVKSLHALAGRLERTDRDAAALARWFAEVA